MIFITMTLMTSIDSVTNRHPIIMASHCTIGTSVALFRCHYIHANWNYLNQLTIDKIWFNAMEWNFYPKWVVFSCCGQWVNSLWPSFNIFWYRSGSTLAQAVACCLMAPRHYLNQCWLKINEVAFTWGRIPQEMLKTSILDMSLTVQKLRLQLHLPGSMS